MLIAIDKPKELTSFDLVKRLKPLFPGEKIGHSGTLDPKATGLMILAIGKDTKKLNTLIGLDKTYETLIDFSKISDTRDLGYWQDLQEFPLLTGDQQGIITPQGTILAPSLAQLQKTWETLIPSAELPLPAFSAKKKQGKRLYQLARKGETLAEKKRMKIHHIELLDYHFPLLKLRLTVGSGTYIRSIAHRLGNTYALGGILGELRRTRIGKRSLEDSRMQETQVDYHMRGQEGSFVFWQLQE